MRVCVCVCLPACLSVCLSVFLYACACVCVCVCVCVRAIVAHRDPRRGRPSVSCSHPQLQDPCSPTRPLVPHPARSRPSPQVPAEIIKIVAVLMSTAGISDVRPGRQAEEQHTVSQVGACRTAAACARRTGTECSGEQPATQASLGAAGLHTGGGHPQV